MESRTFMQDIRVSPRKLRFLLPAVKKMDPKDALEHLFYSHSKPGKVLYKAIKSAVSNAKNYLKVDEASLKFKHLSIEEGHKIKRYRAGGRGTAHTIVRRSSHIQIILEPKVMKAHEKVAASQEKKVLPKPKKLPVSKSKLQSTNVKSNPKLKAQKI